MTWTQPLCRSCWDLLTEGRSPVRVRDDDEYRCCMCDAVTTDGIYVRVNPALVPFPRKEET